jgi:alcohol dehydrogenase, propanol-preferring
MIMPTMRAMVLGGVGEPLMLMTVDKPAPGAGEILIRITACGICRTDLHVVDGELTMGHYPIVPGHQIVGYIEQLGEGVEQFAVNQRVGVPWLGGSCGCCDFCMDGKENLCDQAVYTGCSVNGGFAEYTVASAHYCFTLPDNYSDLQVAPLLCAGLIGFRAYRLAKNAKRIGFYGFGAAAHILIQVARHYHQEVYAFTREGDVEAQHFAKSLGADWSGSSNELPPELLDAAIIFAPVGSLVPQALAAIKKGGKVICAGIYMSDIPSFPYHLLWGERSIHSIANLTRRDGEEFLPLAASIPIKTTVRRYSLEQANEALEDLRHGRFTGAAVVDLNANLHARLCDF